MRKRNEITTKKGKNGTIYRKEDEFKYIRIANTTKWSIQLEQEKLEVPIHEGVSTYEGIGDWKVYVEGTAHETTFGHGEVYLILHSFDGTKSVYKGFGFFKEYSPVTNGSNNFTGQIAGNGALEISES